MNGRDIRAGTANFGWRRRSLPQVFRTGKDQLHLRTLADQRQLNGCADALDRVRRQ